MQRAQQHARVAGAPNAAVQCRLSSEAKARACTVAGHTPFHLPDPSLPVHSMYGSHQRPWHLCTILLILLIRGSSSMHAWCTVWHAVLCTVWSTAWGGPSKINAYVRGCACIYVQRGGMELYAQQVPSKPQYMYSGKQPSRSAARRRADCASRWSIRKHIVRHRQRPGMHPRPAGIRPRPLKGPAPRRCSRPPGARCAWSRPPCARSRRRCT